MLSPVRFVVRLATLASLVLAAAPALADEPPPPLPNADPVPTTAPPVVVEPAPPEPLGYPPTQPIAPGPRSPDPDRSDDTGDEASRDHGMRLGLDLGFARSLGGATDRLSFGSPTLLPIGADLSIRTSKTFMVGAHGYAALASRDDCIAVDSCRGRAYGFGAHVEGMLARGRSWVAWIRYGIGYEILYQGGQPLDSGGHVFRDALDLMDLRVGADFTVHRREEGKTARIGPFIGLVAGAMVNQSGISHGNGPGGQPRNVDRDSGSAHVWFNAGVRATLDP